jgi:hypothetical protein
MDEQTHCEVVASKHTHTFARVRMLRNAPHLQSVLRSSFPRLVVVPTLNPFKSGRPSISAPSAQTTPSNRGAHGGLVGLHGLLACAKHGSILTIEVQHFFPLKNAQKCYF